MAVEFLEEPQVHVKNGTTYHIYAVDGAEPTADGRTAEDQAQQVADPLERAIGVVAIAPSRLARYEENDEYPYMIHETMRIGGLVGEDGVAVYDKTVSPRGTMGIPKPFYGLRIAIAQRRALHRVKSVLKP